MEENMLTPWVSRSYILVAIIAALVAPLGSAKPPVPDLNSTAILIKPPDQIPWVDGGNGALNAVLVGDPTKPGMYVVLTKWTAHHMSRPHFHQYDRYITVISGTWWVGTGTKYDPDSTVPVKAGSFVTHFAKGIHYDGAKDGDTVLEIVGQGPATATP